MKALVERVVEAIQPLNPMGRIGYRWVEPNAPSNLNSWWLVAIYPTPNEAKTGPHEGQKVYPGFHLNLSAILPSFSQGVELVWRAPTIYNGNLDGPEVSLKGTFAGNEVWLRIFSLPPDDEAATLIVDLASGDCWEKPG